jgi:hypothetical protein
MEQSTSLELSSRVKLFHLIYAMIVESKTKVWNQSDRGVQGHYMLCNELCRFFKSLTALTDQSNIFVQKFISNKIREAFMRVENMSLQEMDALFSIVNETALPELHVGSTCMNDQG